MLAATPVRARSPDVMKNKAAAEERRKSMKAQGLSPRAEAARAGKAAKAYVNHLKAIEAAAAKHFAARGPPTAIGTNDQDRAWLEKNAGAPGVVSLPCGLQYRVLKSAKTGARSPKFDTPVEVHYKGCLLGSGEEFYCSYTKTAEPERHVANKIIQGWTVALQLMGVGDKWMLFVPSELGYGDAGSTNGWQRIPPHAALTFELELIAVRSEKAPPKVERPKGMSTADLMAAAAAASAPKPAPNATGLDEENAGGNSVAVGGPGGSGKGGLFERAPAATALGRRGGGGGGGTAGGAAGGLSDASRASSAGGGTSAPPLATGHGGADGGGTGTAAGHGRRKTAVEAGLRAQLTEVEGEAARHAERAEALAEENAQLRASLERAVERAIQWQAEARHLDEQLQAGQGQAGARTEPPPHAIAETIAAAAEADDANDLLALPEGAEPTRAVVLVGATGSGKSSVGCALVGNPGTFGVSGGLRSATAAPACADFAAAPGSDAAEGSGRDGPAVITRVVDTVGMHDSSLPAATAMQRLCAFEDLLPPSGADLFLFILPFGRFSSACEAALDAFVACVGPDALEHTILVFTRCSLSHDELKRELATSAPPALRRIVPRLAFPSVLGIDVVARPAASRAHLRLGVAEGIQALDGARYSREQIAAAIADYGGAQDERERAAFAAAVSDWRRGASAGEEGDGRGTQMHAQNEIS